MSEIVDRARVVAEARTWIGTPYHHAADIKHVGVDCAMLLVRVFADLELMQTFDPRPYTKDWMLHRDEERYLNQLLARAHEVDEAEAGDIMLLRVGRCFAHGGIVSAIRPLRLVHAFAKARRVIEEEVERNAELVSRPHKFFSYWA